MKVGMSEEFIRSVMNVLPCDELKRGKLLYKCIERGITDISCVGVIAKCFPEKLIYHVDVTDAFIRFCNNRGFDIKKFEVVEKEKV